MKKKIQNAWRKKQHSSKNTHTHTHTQQQQQQQKGPKAEKKKSLKGDF